MSFLERLFALFCVPVRFFSSSGPRKSAPKPGLQELEPRRLFSVNPGDVIGVVQPPASDTTTTPAIFKVDSGGNRSALLTLNYPRNAGNNLTPINDVAATAGGTLYVAGDPDGSNTTLGQGIYKLGTTAGSLSLISSAQTNQLAVASNGDLITLRDTSTPTASFGVASIVQVNPVTGAETTLDTFYYTRSPGDIGSQIHDVAAGSDGSVYFAGDPDGSAGSFYADGIYKLGSTPGSFTLVSSGHTDRIAVGPNGDIVGLRDITPGTSGKASIVVVNPTTGAVTDVQDFSYSRGLYESSFHDVAAAPDGTIFFAGDPDGASGGTYSDAIYKLGTTAGSFSVFSAIPSLSLEDMPAGGRMSGVVFGDANGDARFDGGEAGIPGRTVFLDLNHDANLDPGDPSAVTDAGGNFAITNLPSGTYSLRIVLAPSEVVTTSASGAMSVTVQAPNSTGPVDFGVNHPPTAIALSNTVVNASSSDGFVGDVTVSDPDPGATFTYTLSDPRFSVVLGTLRLDPGQIIGPQDGASIPLTITATNAGGLSFSQTFTLKVSGAAGLAKLGAYRPSDGSWSLDANGNGQFDAADTVYTHFSPPGAIGVAGNWGDSSDGRDKIGYFLNGTWHLDANGDGVLDSGDSVFNFGNPGDIPVAGRWDGLHTEVGVFTTRGSFTGFILDVNGSHDINQATVFSFGAPGDTVVVGDWTGDGRTKVGVVRPFTTTGFKPGVIPSGVPAVFSLDLNGNFAYDPGESFIYGSAGDHFVIGDWTGDGVDKIGVYRSSPFIPGVALFTLDTNGDRAYEPGVDQVFHFGLATDQFVVGNWNFQPVQAVGAPPALPRGSPLTMEQLQPIVAQGISDWAAAGLNPTQLAQLEQTQFRIADLPDNLLGVTTPGVITIDANAAGYGWFVDPTPQASEEFDPSGGRLIALPNGAAANRMDLLSVVLHEMGHTFGLLDNDADPTQDAMAASLSPGVRRMPTTAEVDSLFTSGG
jgi:hypothetical protein